jgi:iron complex transport system substrate-binding protein
MRILSLLPAGTEIVCALGAASELVGISHECDFPADIRHLPRVTGTQIDSDAPSNEIDAAVRALVADGKPVFTLDAELIRTLAPDVIITQSLCEVCAVSDGVAQSIATVMAPAPVVVFPLVGSTLTGVWNDIQTVGQIIGRSAVATQLLAALNARVMNVHEKLKAARAPRPRVAVVEWIDPLFIAGHWTPELVRRAGGIDVIAEAGAHSVQTTVEAIRSARPEFLVFAPCGFNVERSTREARTILQRQDWDWARGVEAWAIDGNALTSRPGPRLADAVETMARMFAPALFPPPAPGYARRVI